MFDCWVLKNHEKSSSLNADLLPNFNDNTYGGFLKWGYPKVDGLWWFIFEMDDLGVPPHDLGNLHYFDAAWCSSSDLADTKFGCANSPDGSDHGWCWGERVLKGNPRKNFLVSSGVFLQKITLKNGKNIPIIPDLSLTWRLLETSGLRENAKFRVVAAIRQVARARGHCNSCHEGRNVHRVIASVLPGWWSPRMIWDDVYPSHCQRVYGDEQKPGGFGITQAAYQSRLIRKFNCGWGYYLLVPMVENCTSGLVRVQVFNSFFAAEVFVSPAAFRVCNGLQYQPISINIPYCSFMPHSFLVIWQCVKTLYPWWTSK